MPKDRDESAWFPAKRYGWGWGPPRVWQGWAVMGVFFVLLAGGAAYFLPRRETAAFLACTFLLAGLLMVICWIKGERPRWRWGDDD